jgi:hypothetical protein
MAELALVGVHSRKKWRRGRLDVAPAPDLLKRDFSASRPDERWVADITEFMTGEGKLFLAGVKDLYGRGLVGWSMGTRQTSELVIEAVSMAVARRDPVIPPLHHSDKGCQGGINWSSQHLVQGGVHGTTARLDGDSDGEARHEVAGSASDSAGCGASLLVKDRRGFDERGCGNRQRRVRTGRVALVPRAWRDAIDRTHAPNGQVSVICGT